MTTITTSAVTIARIFTLAAVMLGTTLTDARTRTPPLRASEDVPIAAVTPGARNPDVTQDTIGQTICVSGYTRTIRPPMQVTTKLKLQQLRTGSYAGKLADDGTRGTAADFEEDHFLNLGLGGHPTSVKNLWPQRIASAKVKDGLELRLQKLVCSHRLSLAVAQECILSDWPACARRHP